jgi:hypothetical protein
LIAVVKDFCKGLLGGGEPIAYFKTTVREDNQGCLRLAQLPAGQQTARSKFYAIKMHWFRSWLEPNRIELTYVSTTDQMADMLTKYLPKPSFESNRKLSCGW